MYNKNNNLEEWKVISGFEDYMISSHGRVKRIKLDSFNRELKILKPNKHTNGYFKIQLWKNGIGKWKLIHRLILENFNPTDNMDKLQVNHINGIKSYNKYPENLEWCTSSENTKHAFRIGLENNQGENHPSSKLKEDDVILIKMAFREFGDEINLTELGKVFGVSPQAICDIKKGRNWSHIKIE